MGEPGATSAPTADPVSMTQRLVQTPSVNPVLEAGGAGEGAVAELAAGWLRSWGYQTSLLEVAPGRFNVVARRGPESGPALLLNGHLDTVGVAGMDEPFSGDIRDGRLYGRGSADMKSGVACCLAAAAGLAAEPLTGQLIVALTADEEHASLGMEALVKEGVRADAAVVCEPTGLAVMPAHKGFLWIEAEVSGRAAHGSRPDVGIDAIVHAGHLLVAVDAERRRLAEETHHSLLGPASIHAGTIRGGTAPSIYPDRCSLVLERRTLPGETQETVMAEMARVLDAALDACPDLDAHIEAGLFRAGTEVPADGGLVQELVAACRRGGLPATVAGMTAWVDACFLNEHGTPALCFGPGSIAQAHTAEEWVDVWEIAACARVLTDFARSFLVA